MGFKVKKYLNNKNITQEIYVDMKRIFTIDIKEIQKNETTFIFTQI